MRLMGFNFTKISAERLKDKAESIKFNTKINLSSIESVNSSTLKIKEEIVKIGFDYTLIYEPDFAKIEISGNALFAVDSKISKESIKNFKEKGLQEDFKIFVLNVLLKKVNLKALQLEEELNIPFHLPIISLNKESFKGKEKSN